MKVRETHACYGHRLMMHSFCSERSFSRSPRRRTHTLSSLHPRPRHARACCLRPVGPSLRIRGCFLSTFARQPPTCSVPPFPSPQLLRLSSRSPLEHLFLGEPSLTLWCTVHAPSVCPSQPAHVTVTDFSLTMTAGFLMCLPANLGAVKGQ